MRKRPSTMPLVDLALTKALDQLAVAQTAARLCDKDLAIEIAAATAMLEAVSAKTTSAAANERTMPPTVRGGQARGTHHDTDLRSRRQHARDREVVWMASAMINARYSVERFAPLLSLVRDWPDAKLCALADRIAPTPGILKDRQVALGAVERVLCSETELKDRIGQISREVALVFGGFQEKT